MRPLLLSILLISVLAPFSANADYTHRLGLGIGVVHLNNPSQTSFELGGEYEYRFEPILGVGTQVNYIFSSPSIVLLAIPVLYVHPLAGDWIIHGSPIFEFGSGISTQVGVRLGTRIPIPLGVITILPSVAVDFIGGGEDLIFGVGIQI